MNYDNFKKLKPSEKWFYVWTALDNHLHSIKEIKWIMRIITGGIVVYIVKHLLSKW